MDKNNETYTIKNFIKNFSDAFGKTVECIKTMSDIYVDAIKHYPDTARGEFRKNYPEVQESTWDAFEAIGNGSLNAKAFFLNITLRKEISNLPSDLQTKIFKGKCPSFKVVNPSNMRVATVNLADMDSKQFNLVFDKKDGVVRSVNDQKVIIKNTPKAEKVSTIPSKWEIVGNKVVIGGLRFTLAEIDEIREALANAN